MLVIVGEKGQRRVLIEHARLKDLLIPGPHLLEASGLIDHVCELCRFCYLIFSFRVYCRVSGTLGEPMTGPVVEFQLRRGF